VSKENPTSSPSSRAIIAGESPERSASAR
jgi:hypothetical protein